jgi:hypothetical protein
VRQELGTSGGLKKRNAGVDMPGVLASHVEDHGCCWRYNLSVTVVRAGDFMRKSDPD